MGTLLHQFRSDLSSCKYIFKSGVAAEFVLHWYRTRNPTEIAELNAEILAGIGHIMIVPGEETIDSDDVDPAVVLKKRIIAEYLASQKHAENLPDSFSQQTTQKPAGTDVAGVNSALSLSGSGGAAAVSNASVGSAKAVPVGSIKPNIK